MRVTGHEGSQGTTTSFPSWRLGWFGPKVVEVVGKATCPKNKSLTNFKTIPQVPSKKVENFEYLKTQNYESSINADNF